MNRQLREERERIFKLVEIYAEEVKQRDGYMATLREKAAETALLRREMSSLRTSANAHKKQAATLRGMLEGLTPQTKTSI
ncbi:hypothetical protein [Pseudomonas sp. GW456-12-1-14-TSB6]|uniref:hypothetical protein n=1 Tax=Pseudomonas sp. GW456-12-1-14-TSB6 TaxID=2751350 RepID=UPI000CD196F1|nr:hypothetical protein [Pseudomonas sp. GW456-12-1-14-TSB6]POA40740.1 hypothetical protein C1891_00255 [Pseudomonas sp. GW456-12-1-14-TSB6]